MTPITGILHRYRPTAGWCIIPAALFLVTFFVYPSLKLFLLSFLSPALTFANYRQLISTDIYVKVLFNTLRISATVSVICVLLAYPLAFLLASVRDRIRNILIIAVVLPFFTSVLVRSYAWIALLGDQGVVNKILLWLGIIHTPLRLIYNTTGLLIAMTHILLPMAVLLLLSVMRGIDRRLVHVSASLGANRLQTFLRIHLPLTLPGLGAAAVLVFIFTMGNYITAALLGGTRDTMLAMVIAQEVDELLNWPFAGALATVLTGTTILLFLLFNRALNLDRMWGGDAIRGDGTRRPRRSSHLRGVMAQGVLTAIDAVHAALVTIASPLRRIGRLPAIGGIDVFRLALWLLAGGIMAFLLVPILLIFPISFTNSLYLTFPPEGLSLRWYRELIDQHYWAVSTLLSLRVGILTMLLSLAFGIPAAMVLVRRQFFGRTALYAFFISPLIVPSITIAVSIYYFFAPLHLVGTATGLVIGDTIGGISLVTVLVAAALKGFDRSVERASLSLGAGVLRTFARIMAPLLRPAILAAAFFAFMHSFDEVVIATFVGGVSAETLPKKMWEGVELEIRPTLAALSALLIVFTAAMLLAIEFLQRRRTQA